MHFKRILATFFLAGSLIAFFSGLVVGQTVSNEGTEFWAVFPTHVAANLNGVRPLANYTVFITGKQASSGIITVGSFSQTFNLTQPNTVISISIPRNAAYINESEANTILQNRAIRIKVDPGKPKVVVYGHIFAGARSAASLILPKEALGQKYFSMNFTQQSAGNEGKNHIVIIATEPSTKIFLKRGNVDLVPGGIFLNNVGDVYEYLEGSDLTGVEISSDPITSACKRFAVFSGSSTTYITTSNCFGNLSSDPLYQQNYPVDSWGTSYGFIPFSNRSPTGSIQRANGNFLRVLAKENGTEVKIDGVLVGVLNAGQYYQTPGALTRSVLITSNNPVAVAQYALTQICAGGGVSDPDMVILNPVEFNIKDITVYSSTKEDITQQYVNIFIKTAAASSFKINGNAPSSSFSPLPAAPEYSYLQISLNQYNTSAFRLSADDGFNAIAYGFGDYESYAYSAGTNLASNQSITAVRKVTREELSNACTQEDFDFKVVLQAEADTIFWKFDTNDPGVKQVNPQGNPIQINDKTLYEYFYPRTYVFDTPGQKIIKVTVDYKDKNTCSSTKDHIDFVFEVYDPSIPLFDSPDEVCETATVSFTDKSTAKFKAISRWFWDFGDGATSTLQNPTHKYARYGEYTVKLIADNETACIPDTFSKKIKINAKAVPDFSATDGLCANNTITFTDASSIPEGNIVKWIWDFGDETIIEVMNNQPVTHTYQKIGTYDVKLTLVSNSGCESQPSVKPVTVFSPTLSMGSMAYIIEGESVVLNVAAAGNNLRFKWTPALALNRDDIQNPVASPLSDITYSLTITSEEGCELTDTIAVRVLPAIKAANTFTPNGDGVNDVWTIENLNDYPGSEIHIYNRYGVKLFSSVGYPDPWDGKYQGEVLPVGTYYYIIDPKNGRKAISGSITILR